MKKDVIVYGMMSWPDYSRGVDNTNAHILRWLVKRDDVSRILFVDFSQYNFISRLKYYLKNLASLPKEHTEIWSIFNRLEKVNDKMYRYSTLNYDAVKKIAEKMRFTNLEIWSFNPFYTGWTAQFPTARKIFYAIDDWRQNKLFSGFYQILDKNYRWLGEKADLIFTPSNKVKNELWPGNVRVHIINNAVDIDHYQHPGRTASDIRHRIDSLLPKNKKAIVGYLGVITPDRVDYDLVQYLLQHHPDKNFIFAGPVWGGFNSQALIKQHQNVRFIGMVYYQEMPYLLSRFDVCLIPHRLSSFIQSMNPKKLYEYLAAGKPIVSTPVAGTEAFKNVIYLVNTPEEFSQKINQSISEDSLQLQEMRLKSVIPHSWQIRLEEIKKILTE